MISKRRHTVATALLASFLLGPFFLRLISGPLEPYPAILLPSGATLIRSQDGAYSATRTELYGRTTEGGSWTHLDNRSFLQPVRAHFLTSIEAAGFGLEPRPERSYLLNYFRRHGNTIDLEFDKISPQDIAETKEWIQEKLRSAGCQDHEFRLVKRRIKRRLADGVTVSDEIASERIYELD